MASEWTLSRGANLLTPGMASFQVWAPNARELSVVVSGPGGEREQVLFRDRNGIFAGEAAASAGELYMYRLDGGALRPDPVSRLQPEGVHGRSCIVDPGAFTWTDREWRGVSRQDLIFYELHPGAFSERGDFEGIAEKLPYLQQLGISAIELMPVGHFAGMRNWGYDGVAPFAPHTVYGGTDGLKRLINECHRTGIAVFIDVVYNHFGPEGNYLSAFGPYFTHRYPTPWGEAVNFDGALSDEVRRYFIDNALYWLCEYHADGLRLDATHSIYDFSPIHILEEIARAAKQFESEEKRTVHIVAENDHNDPRIVRPAEEGGYGLAAQWNEDFHHAVHSVLTGERQGYFCDFGSVSQVAKCLEKNYVYDGCYSNYRKRRHGAPASFLNPAALVSFVQNHDQIGNRALGERLSALVDYERERAAACLLLLSPFLPLLFMGQEYGEKNPFLYFIDHTDPDLVRAVREGRRQECGAILGGEFNFDAIDPKAEATLEQSRLNWRLLDEEPHRKLLQMHRDLLLLRRGEPLLHSGGSGRECLLWEREAGLTLILSDGSRTGIALFNLSGQAASAAIPVIRTPLRRRFDSARYSIKSVRECPAVIEAAGVRPELPPFAAAFYSTGSDAI